MTNLNVYLNDIKIGIYSQNNQGEESFEYDEEYIQNHKQPLSLSMPLKDKKFSNNKTAPFFSGLLPDEDFREKLARYLGVAKENTFSLLNRVGRECAGAVSFYPEGEEPESYNIPVLEQLDEQQFIELLNLMKQHPLLAEFDGIRLSLAGAQNKLAVGYEQGKVCLVKNGYPTTHIIKPIIDRAGINSSVQNEFFCMKLSADCGIPSPEVNIIQIGDISCFMISRYDRKKINGKVVRIHQEDFCQALSISPILKYQVQGGPGISDCLNILRDYSSSPVLDMDLFMKMIQFNYLIGNADAHAKNYSILYLNDQNSVRLAPIYDLMDTDVYDQVSKKMAMKIGKKYDAPFIFKHHWLSYFNGSNRMKEHKWEEMLKFNGFVFKQAEQLIEKMKKEDNYCPIYEKIYQTIKQRISFMEKNILSI